ncbi:hypothetical protein KR215_004127, partial [Drosophila sulfurigaster]
SIMSTSLDATICAYFVDNTTSDGDNVVAEQFAEALRLMRDQLADTQIREIRPSEGFPLIAGGGLTKQDVFVIARFEGDFFEQLQTTKALILGPPCIIDCLTRCTPVPLGTSPIYSTAMRDLQISASGVSTREKDELKKLIHWMGGHYFQNFGRNITHLISNTIKSNKYEHATLNGVAVMHVDWVQRVWERHISAQDPQFEKYRLPTFFGANITCSGLEASRKEAVMRLVNENGGNYHRAFRSQQVDIVITEQSKTDSEKYKAALRFKKDILLPEWIFESAARGYALPTKQYEVRPRKQMSTPTKQRSGEVNQTSDQLPDLSCISFMSNAAGRRMCSDNTTLNETQTSNSGGSGVLGVASEAGGAGSAAKQLLKQATSQHAQQVNYQQTLAEICPRQAKKAGSFLDGCCVYLSGFRTAEREKLHRVLNTGGATRYDDPHEGLTHIIVAQLDMTAYRQWQADGLLAACQVVQLEWLRESIRLARIASEVPHRVALPDAAGVEPTIASPGSKRTLRSMNHSFKQPATMAPIKKKLFELPAEEAEPELEPSLLTQYAADQEPAMPLPAACSTQLNNTVTPAAPSAPAPAAPPAVAVALPDLSASTLSIDFDKLDYLQGATVYVHPTSFSSELYDQMVSECQAAQGCLVSASYTDPVDFAIVSFEQLLDVSTLPVRWRHLVTELYLESCMKQNKLLQPLEYYHQPVPQQAKANTLAGMTIVVSIYAGLERDFINALAELQGGSLNKAFVKKERPLLVCSSAEGSKYEGALKWGYPVVTAQWLLHCAQRGEKLPFAGYLVGTSAAEFPASPRLRESNKQLPPPPQEPQQQQQQTPLSHRSSSKQREQLQPEPQQMQQQENQVTPLRNPRISELVTGLASTRRRSSSGDSSPQTPLQRAGAGTGACNFEFLEQVAQRLDTSQARDCVRQIIREMRENQTPELERIRRQACTPVNRRQAAAQHPAPGIPDFCLTPEFQQRMADDFERRWRLPKQQLKPDTPIAVIRQRVMRITCETLGIEYTSGEDDQQQQQQLSVQVQEPPTPTGRPLFQARKTATPTATPKATPKAATATPKRRTASPASPFVPNTQPQDEQPSSNSCATINFDKISFEESSADNMSELRQITDYLKSRESRRSSLKRDHDGQARSQAQFVQPFESEGFALGTNSEDMVDWRDPVDFNGDQRRSESGIGASTSPRMQHQGTPPCFSISSSDDDERRQQLIERIRGLGGTVCQNLVNYDPECTHLLCERPNRGEKLLGCMAAGKWILTIQYIEQCHAKGVFLDESLCEWGNPKALNLPPLTPEEQPIAVAAHRWRLDGGGAFRDQRVILSLQERSLAAIRNVLRAGGACILEPQLPFGSDDVAAGATHCFVDVKKAPLAAADLEYLQQHGVRIMSQMWINSYLMGGRDANLEKYVLR